MALFFARRQHYDEVVDWSKEDWNKISWAEARIMLYKISSSSFQTVLNHIKDAPGNIIKTDGGYLYQYERDADSGFFVIQEKSFNPNNLSNDGWHRISGDEIRKLPIDSTRTEYYGCSNYFDFLILQPGRIMKDLFPGLLVKFEP